MTVRFCLSMSIHSHGLVYLDDISQKLLCCVVSCARTGGRLDPSGRRTSEIEILEAFAKRAADVDGYSSGTTGISTGGVVSWFRVFLVNLSNAIQQTLLSVGRPVVSHLSTFFPPMLTSCLLMATPEESVRAFTCGSLDPTFHILLSLRKILVLWRCHVAGFPTLVDHVRSWCCRRYL